MILLLAAVLLADGVAEDDFNTVVATAAEVDASGAVRASNRLVRRQSERQLAPAGLQLPPFAQPPALPKPHVEHDLSPDQLDALSKGLAKMKEASTNLTLQA